MDGKKLEDMSLEQLWQLFPIELDMYNPEWPRSAAVETERLQQLLVDYKPVIHHIGSTAVPGLLAKPIVDLLVETDGAERWPEIIQNMKDAGYILMSQRGDRMSFNKGYTPDGYSAEVFHIHFHLRGDNDELLFRDYLRLHPEAARRYAELKQSLLPRFKHDRDAYTEAKTAFVTEIVARAKGFY